MIQFAEIKKPFQENLTTLLSKKKLDREFPLLLRFMGEPWQNHVMMLSGKSVKFSGKVKGNIAKLSFLKRKLDIAKQLHMTTHTVYNGELVDKFGEPDLLQVIYWTAEK